MNYSDIDSDFQIGQGKYNVFLTKLFNFLSELSAPILKVYRKYSSAKLTCFIK